MDLEKLVAFFDTSPVLHLLHSPNAPFIVDFLDRQFKQSRRIAIPHSDLLAALVGYQEELQESYPGRLQAKADTYLADWCSALWLRRLLDAEHDERVYQLTPHAEDAIVFLGGVMDKDLGFVGTESRLKLVIDTLSDIVVGSSDDPETRLKHLRSELAGIQAQIKQIENGGNVSRYQPAQIRERFATQN